MGIFMPILNIALIIVGSIVLICIIITMILSRHRFAEYFWDDGARYQGQVNSYGINGKGTLYLASGDVYEGKFKKGQFNGTGTYFWADGSSYVGKFKKGRPVDGNYTDELGNVFKCRYKYLSNGARITKEYSLIHQETDNCLELKSELEIETVKLVK